MKLGHHLREAIARGHQKDFVSDCLGMFALTEEELKKPWLHRESLAKKLANAEEIEVIDLWEACYGSISSSVCDEQGWRHAQRIMEAMTLRRAMRVELEEEEVMSSAFQLLTQAKLFTTMQATYALTPKVSDELFGSFNSPFEVYDHQIPSDAPRVEYMHQGEEYRERPLTDRFCKTRAFKFGARVSLTREVMMTDKTGQVIEHAKGLAESAAYIEDSLACLAWQDVSNKQELYPSTQQFVFDENVADAGCYYPEGTQVPLYRTVAAASPASRAAGQYEVSVNKISPNADLSQWDSITAAIILLKKMVNPRQGQLIDVLGGSLLKLVVPVGLEGRASNLTAPGVQNYIASPGNPTATGMIRVPDGIQKLWAPFGGGPSSIQPIVWNKLPTATVAAQSTWYLGGDSKKQFRKHVRWAPEFMQASQPQLGGDDFKRDVILSARGGFNGGSRAVDDKYVIQCVH